MIAKGQGNLRIPCPFLIQAGKPGMGKTKE